MELQPLVPTVKGPETKFTGVVYLDALKRADGQSRLWSSLVHFTPGARSFWHSHAHCQLLHCTAGNGLVVSRDGTVIRLRPGATVWTPAGEEHWHGALSDSTLTHLVMLEGTAHGDGATWLDAVDEAVYLAAQS